jgi:L-lactate dehydrogenase complex protein LldF
MDDLGLLLQLLARSATGQRLTVYTSVISGPRRAGETDGPEEFHLVLLDNGRSRILSEQYAEALMCIRCGACLNICPVYQTIGGHAYGGVYPGPIGAVLTPLLQPDLAEVEQLPYASSLCGACQEVCPVRIAIPDMLLRLRADAVAAGKAPVGERLAMSAWQQTMNNPAFFELGGQLASIGTRALARGGWLGWLPPPLSAWTQSRAFPAFAPRSFSEQWYEREQRSKEQE